MCVVHDTDEALDALQRLLLEQQLLFAELEPEELRGMVQRAWAIARCEVGIALVGELPAAQSTSLDDFEVRVVLPQALLDDPEVASTLRITTMGSSEL